MTIDEVMELPRDQNVDPQLICAWPGSTNEQVTRASSRLGTATSTMNLPRHVPRPSSHPPDSPYACIPPPKRTEERIRHPVQSGTRAMDTSHQSVNQSTKFGVQMIAMDVRGR